MSTLLHIESSPRIARSHSRKLGHGYVAAWQAARPGSRVITRDFANEPPPFVSETWVAAAYNAPANRSPAEQAAIAISDHYIDELLAADEIVIATPMYNLSVPATLKAWIDQIVRFGRTFDRNAEGYVGLIKSKTVIVIVASGSDLRPGTPGGSYNCLDAYLRGIFGFIGLTDVNIIYAHSLNDDSPQREQVLTETATTLRQLAATT